MLGRLPVDIVCNWIIFKARVYKLCSHVGYISQSGIYQPIPEIFSICPVPETSLVADHSTGVKTDLTPIGCVFTKFPVWATAACCVAGEAS